MKAHYVYFLKQIIIYCPTGQPNSCSIDTVLCLISSANIRRLFTKWIPEF